jgi:hypothetical protein
MKSPSRRTWHGQMLPHPKPTELDTFELLGLPDDVAQVYKQARGIKKLYGLFLSCNGFNIELQIGK